MPIRSLDRISVAEPCNADWDAMRGNDQVRFCSHCKLHVTDLSKLTRREAMLLVARSEGRLCVRYVQGPAGDILTKAVPVKLHHIARRISRLAAGAFTAAITFSTAGAQSNSDRSVSAVPGTAIDCVLPSVEGGKLSGVITDPNGAFVPGVTVSVTNKLTQTVFVFVTTEDGRYEFAGLAAGPYSLAVEAPGFAKPIVAELDVDSKSDQTRDFSLELQPVVVEVEVKSEDTSRSVTMGVVAVSEPKEPLIKAAYKDDLDLVVQLIPVTTNVNLVDEYTNTTALAYAVENHNLQMVRALLAGGASINTTDRSGQTPLMHLGKEASIEFVRELLAAGALVNARAESGETVLMSAARVCTLDVLKELIAAGARIDAQDNERNTILMSAAENDDVAVVRFLVTAGVAIDARNENGSSALSVAARYGHSDIVQALVDAGATINLSPSELNEALLAAAGNEDAKAVKIFLMAGADPNSKDESDETALMRAAEHGHPEAIQALIDAGADLNAVNGSGWTAMMFADDVENVRTLLNAGADASIKNRDGETALAMAIKYDQTEIIAFLKSRGAPQ